MSRSAGSVLSGCFNPRVLGSEIARRLPSLDQESGGAPLSLAASRKPHDCKSLPEVRSKTRIISAPPTRMAAATSGEEGEVSICRTRGADGVILGNLSYIQACSLTSLVCRSCISSFLSPRSIEPISARLDIRQRHNFPSPSEITSVCPSEEKRMATANSPTFVSKTRLANCVESAELQTSMSIAQVGLPSSIPHFRTAAAIYSPFGEMSASSTAPLRSIEWSKTSDSEKHCGGAHRIARRTDKEAETYTLFGIRFEVCTLSTLP